MDFLLHDQRVQPIIKQMKNNFCYGESILEKILITLKRKYPLVDCDFGNFHKLIDNFELIANLMGFRVDFDDLSEEPFDSIIVHQVDDYQARIIVVNNNRYYSGIPQCCYLC